MATKKQPAKKKSSTKKTTKKNNEVELLDTIIKIFDSWDSEQRSRNLKYLASKYYDFL